MRSKSQRKPHRQHVKRASRTRDNVMATPDSFPLRALEMLLLSCRKIHHIGHLLVDVCLDSCFRLAFTAHRAVEHIISMSKSVAWNASASDHLLAESASGERSSSEPARTPVARSCHDDADDDDETAADGRLTWRSVLDIVCIASALSVTAAVGAAVLWTWFVQIISTCACLMLSFIVGMLSTDAKAKAVTREDHFAVNAVEQDVAAPLQRPPPRVFGLDGDDDDSSQDLDFVDVAQDLDDITAGEDLDWIECPSKVGIDT